MFGPYTDFTPADGEFYSGVPLDSSTPTTLSNLGVSLQSFTIYLTFEDSSLSGTINGSLTLNHISSPSQSLSGLQGATGTLDNGAYDYSLNFTSGGLIGSNPNGTWTLFLQDTSGAETLVSWGLGDITAVPEPVNVALGIFGGVVLFVIVVRSRPVRNRLHCWKAAFVRWVNAV